MTTDEQPPIDFRKSCHPHGRFEPDHRPLSLTLLSLMFYRFFVNAVWCIVAITQTWKNNLLRKWQSDFRPKDALLFAFYLQSCFVYILHCSTCDSNNILAYSKDKSTMWRHITIVLFSLIVGDYRLWLVDMKLYIFDASPDLPEVRSSERSKLWLFVCVTKSSFNHRSLAFSCLFWVLLVFAVSHWALR